VEDIPVTLSALIWPFCAAFCIFALWMLWIIAKSVKGVEQSLKQIASEPQSQS
jgi:hypothetical protein